MPSVTDRYDPLDATILRDPYPVLAELRSSNPVFWHEGMGSWALTRYADCVAVLRDHATFARDPRRTGGTVTEPSLSVQSLDPPQQGRIRSLFITALHAQDLTAVESRARRLVLGRLEDLADGDVLDVVSEIAVPLSVAVVADLFGSSSWSRAWQTSRHAAGRWPRRRRRGCGGSPGDREGPAKQCEPGVGPRTPAGASRPRPSALPGPGCELRLCRSCHNELASAMGSASTSADRPVILRSVMIAAGERVRHYTTMIDDRELDVSPPTAHELVSWLSVTCRARDRKGGQLIVM
ncbi:hypothetical protein [Streptomyces sp. NPDC001307]|uniref:hypothetical protein n=1 Tax=Streptomyces sp. NPDC001307 TaxID=3364560 RepID=UPI003691445D